MKKEILVLCTCNSCRSQMAEGLLKSFDWDWKYFQQVLRGECLEEIKELLGHSSITKTEIYAHHNTDQLHDKVPHLDNQINPDKSANRKYWPFFFI